MRVPEDPRHSEQDERRDLSFDETHDRGGERQEQKDDLPPGRSSIDVREYLARNEEARHLQKYPRDSRGPVGKQAKRNRGRENPRPIPRRQRGAVRPAGRLLDAQQLVQRVGIGSVREQSRGRPVRDEVVSQHRAGLEKPRHSGAQRDDDAGEGGESPKLL